MFDIMTHIPRLNQKVDFSKLKETLTRAEEAVISKINDMVTLGDLSLRLKIPANEILEAVTGLLKRRMIHFDDPMVAASLQVKLADLPIVQHTANTAPTAPRKAEPPRPKAGEDEKEALPVQPDRMGSWDIESLFGLLADVHRARETGTLRVHNEEEKYKSLHFVEGELIQVQSQPFDAGHCFGRILQRAGRVTQEHVVESLVSKKRSDTLQGEEFVRMGLIRSDELDELLAKQIELKLHDLMKWEGGTWEFFASEAPRRLIPVNVRLSHLAYALIWKLYDFDRVPRAGSPNLHTKFIGAAEDPPYTIESFGTIDKLPKVWNAFKGVDVPFHKLELLLRMNLETIERFIWTLHLLGMLVLLDHPRSN